MITKELKEKIEKEIKFWAKNNMCASCYSDIEVFSNNMQDIIDGYDNEDIIQDCVDELLYVGVDVTDEVVEYIKQLIQKEAKYWLKDYYKHKKDYDPEEIEYDY